MGKMMLKVMKKKHIDYLSSELKKSHNRSVEMYLKNCIISIEKEIYPKDLPEIQYDKSVYHKLSALGFESNESLIISYLFKNEVLQAGELSDITKIERGKIYRILDNWMELGIVGKAEATVNNFYIVDKLNPFKNVIQKKEKRIEELSNFNKMIVEVSND